MRALDALAQKVCHVVTINCQKTLTFLTQPCTKLFLICGGVGCNDGSALGKIKSKNLYPVLTRNAKRLKKFWCYVVSLMTLLCCVFDDWVMS